MSKVNGYEVGVTREDTEPPPTAAGSVHIMLGPADYAWGGLLAGIKGADGLPGYRTKWRDAILRRSGLVNGMWGSVVMQAATKVAARGYTVEDRTDSQVRVSRAQQILDSYGPGWTRGLLRGLQDYLLTNMGQVIAVERAQPKPGARITGLIHLDSLRCYPTNDDAYPILYQAPTGAWRLLPDWGVIHLSDMPSPDYWARGIGQCAADRAWEPILLDTAIGTYFREKVSGTRNLAIHIIRGIAPQQLKDALSDTDEARNQRQFLLYKGSTLIPLLSDQEVQLTTIPLAEIPDGFDVDLARKDIYLRWSHALGIPVQDVQPLSGQGLGTGVQTQVLDDAAEGRGLAAYPKLLAEALNALVLPETTVFAVSTNDVRDQEAKAKVALLRAQERAARIASGEISPAMARQLALDAGDLPPELVSQDATTGGTLDSDDKPVDPQALLSRAAALFPAPSAPPSAGSAAPPPARAVVKAAGLSDADVDRLVEAALQDRTAWDWAKKAVEEAA